MAAEDYDAAKSLKVQVDALRQQAADSPSTPRGGAGPMSARASRTLPLPSFKDKENGTGNNQSDPSALLSPGRPAGAASCMLTVQSPVHSPICATASGLQVQGSLQASVCRAHSQGLTDAKAGLQVLSAALCLCSIQHIQPNLCNSIGTVGRGSGLPASVAGHTLKASQMLGQLGPPAASPGGRGCMQAPA